MAQAEANSSPLSSPSASPPRHLSPTGSTALVQDSTPAMIQPEVDLASTASLDSAIQTQQVQTPQLFPSSAPTSNMSAKRSARQSPKRAREEDDDDDEPAFGTPPPKRVVSKANGKTNGGATARRAPAPKKPAPKKAVAPPPTRSRPSRNRKAPERFEDLEEKTTPKAHPTKKGSSKVFDPVFITTNSTSRLVKADIYVSVVTPGITAKLTSNSICFLKARLGQVSMQSSRAPSSQCFQRILRTRLS